YYEDYGDPQQLITVLSEPFLYSGSYSRHRRRRHGAPAVGLDPSRFVVCIQNHDQIGNRMRGERLSSLLKPEQLRFAAAFLLLSPYVPLLFMGEEYGEENPFQFFCSFENPDLIEAVREGRKNEFKSF